MGTHGFWSYYNKGWHHVHFNINDSYPSREIAQNLKDPTYVPIHSFLIDLGLEVAAKVPVGDPEKYQKWLEDLRESLDRDLEEMKQSGRFDTGFHFCTQTAPQKGLQTDPMRAAVYTSWMYEMNLDHQVFLGEFRKNMPSSEELFQESIGFDPYANRAYSPSTPIQHIYNWTSPPPPVEDGTIDNYAAIAQHSNIPVEDLLSITPKIEQCEATRIAMYEVTIGQMMTTWVVSHSIRRLEALPDRSHISNELLAIGMDMVNATVGGSRVTVAGFMWLTEDLCLRITTHLGDEGNRKKGILELTRHIVDHQTQHPGVKYGLLLSFFHCVIIKVEPNGGVICTPPLQFLPSFHAESPSTPGITALARLSYNRIATPVHAGDIKHPFPADHIFNRVPEDVWWIIAENLGFTDLHDIPPVLPQLTAPANSLLRYPHVGDHRLVAVVEGVEEEESEHWRDRENASPIANPVLVSRTFSTAVDGAFVKIGGRADQGWACFSISVGGEMHEVIYSVLNARSIQSRQ
ncbi:hypothetical protein B0H11DRAFT_2409826 [Mycena galericulata]|nr:hypothetical protein B0H11DRAFT_2409826 [Mycena galericulata]